MWAAVALIVLSILSLAINLYFWSLLCSMPAWLTRLLASTAKACGIDGGSCKRVVQTPYARLLGGSPNMIVGTLWSVVVIVLGAIYLSTGVWHLWTVCVVVSLGSVVVGIYLTAILFFILKDP